MVCRSLGSSVHGILQARILEWVAISFLRVSSWPGDQTCISCIGRQVLYYWTTKDTHQGDWGLLNRRRSESHFPRWRCPKGSSADRIRHNFPHTASLGGASHPCQIEEGAPSCCWGLRPLHFQPGHSSCSPLKEVGGWLAISQAGSLAARHLWFHIYFTNIYVTPCGRRCSRHYIHSDSPSILITTLCNQYSH